MVTISTNIASGFRSKFSKILPASLLLAMNLYIFGTYTIYKGNASEFEFGYLNLLVVLVFPMIITVFILSFAGVFMPHRKLNRYISIIFVAGILIWIQSSFLVWDYGVFDGRGLKWDNISWQGWFEVSIWLFLIIIAVVYSNPISRYASLMSLVFVVLQLFIAVGEGLTAKENIWIKKYSSQNKAPEEIFNYSSTKNVIHIIFDGFQTDTFLEIVKEESLEKNFDGFVVFKDNMGVASLTSFSIPAIFSGDVYDGSVPPNTYFERAIAQKGFQNSLYDEGYTVNLIPTLSMRKGKYTNYYAAPTLYTSSAGKRTFQNATYLLDVALFREFPHFIKKYIFNDNNWLLSNSFSLPPNITSFQQRAFLRDYINNIHAENPESAYHFIHIMSPHPPYVTDKNGEYAGRVLPHTKENYKNQARSILRVFVNLLEKLKKIGLYDSSLILLHGDHGGDFPPVIDGKEINIGVGRVPALLVIKPPHRKGKLIESNAKTSVADIPATVMDLLTLENIFEGKSIFRIDTNEKRSRVFIIYGLKNKKEPMLQKYTIEGSIYNLNSWNNSMTVPVRKLSNSYAWGTKISFGIEGNAEPFKGEGWSFPFSGHEWNNGRQAALDFMVEIPDNDIIFETKLIPFIKPGKVEKQRIKVIVNGKALTEWTTTEYKTYTFKVKIPKEFVRSQHMTITFELPDAVVPISIDAGGDARMVGIAMLTARMSSD